MTRRQMRFTDAEYRDQADFRTALRTFLSVSEERARSAGLTPQQYLLLLVTRGHRSYPHVAINELAEALKLQQSTVSLLVDRAVKRELLSRVESQVDRRRVEVSLTAHGQTLLDEIMDDNRRAIETLEGGLFSQSLVRALRERDNAENAAAQRAGGGDGDVLGSRSGRR